MDFASGITMFQLLVPVTAAGALLVGAVFLFFLYSSDREPRYLSTAIVALLGFLFTIAEAGLLILGTKTGWHDETHIVHRVQQVAATLFLFALPFLTGTLLEKSSRLKRFTMRLVWVMAGATLLILIAAVLRPDLFVSPTVHYPAWMTNAAHFARGHYGPLIPLRDCLLGGLILYTMIVLARELFRSRDYGPLGTVLAGFMIAGYFAVMDMLKTDLFIDADVILTGPFEEVSKFSVGVFAFVLFSILGVVSIFARQSRRFKQAIRSLDRSERMFAQIADSIGEAFWLSDLKEGNLLYLNAAFERIWESPVSEIYGDPRSWMIRVHPQDRAYVRRIFDNLQSSDRLEYRLQFDGGREKWVSDSVYLVRNEQGEVYRLARVVEDISERKKAEDELSFLAYFDTLTLLPNRRSFFERFKDTLVRARDERNEKMRSLVMMDLDNFKTINDAFGHDKADRLLVEVAARIKACLDQKDYLFRLGSDEFVIVLSMQDSEDQTIRIVQKIRQQMQKRFVIDQVEIAVSASFGVSLFPRDGESREELVRSADIALFHAKKEKNAVRLYEPAMLEEANRRMNFVNRLRIAVDRNEFLLVYQPFVDLSGRITGAEALVRWKDPSTGTLIAPSEFIPVAEETGLIIPLGAWIIEEACRTQRQWSAMGNGIRISVNLSPRQFRQNDIVERVLDAIRQAGISPADLDCEITESSVMEEPETAIDKMKRLVAEGVRLSIDDFGTGYSSLGYLHRFPVHNLKIDRSFVAGLESTSDTTPLVRTIIGLAHSMELKTVAEGVETRSQAEKLRGLSCDMFQGFLFSKPLIQEDFAALLRAPVFKM
jgi:diguanylate cyclase (GGDEF)-like protein/PAS domain S-box-containing protein